MIPVNGVIVDMRTMPRALQEQAYQLGLIPSFRSDHLLKPMGWVVDMRHYLDEETGDLPDGLPTPVLNLALFFGSIVAWVPLWALSWAAAASASSWTARSRRSSGAPSSDGGTAHGRARGVI